jgi:antitoxin PrlF
MPLSSTVNRKGQITVPLEVRNRLGLKEGDCVEFVLESDRTTIRPVGGSINPFLKYVGALPAFSGAKETNCRITWLSYTLTVFPLRAAS